MTNGWLALDRMASARGDGLRAEFRALLADRAARASHVHNVVEIASLRGNAMRQAGPMPGLDPSDNLPENVARFPGSNS